MNNSSLEASSEEEDRRRFLKSCGRFAIVMPPAINLLLSTSMTSTAISRSVGNIFRDPHDHDRHDHDGDERF